MTTERDGRPYHSPCVLTNDKSTISEKFKFQSQTVQDIFGGQNNILKIDNRTIVTTRSDLIITKLSVHKFTYCLSSLKGFRKSIDAFLRKMLGKKE